MKTTKTDKIRVFWNHGINPITGLKVRDFNNLPHVERDIKKYYRNGTY